jgi:hypothetical protein
MGGDIERHGVHDRQAAELVERYAGFVAAEDLTPAEQIAALSSIIPMALQVVDEARDTIERLNNEVQALRAQDAERTVDADVEGEPPKP